MRFHELTEAKQVGLLYHFTGLHEAWAILDQKVMKIGDKNGSFSATGGMFVMTQPRTHISLTRNPRLRLPDGNPWGEVRIVLDGDRLSNRYKISPYLDTDHSIVRDDGQAEEAIRKDEVNIEGCVARVDFNYPEWVRKNTQWFTANLPDEDKAKYTRISREDAAMFVREVRKLGYDLRIVKRF